MNSELIILVPALFSLWIVCHHSPQRALFSIYIPVLLLLPDYFSLPIRGLPDPTFSQSAILPIGIAISLSAITKKSWKYSYLDAAVGSYVLWAFMSDWHDVSYSDAQNLLFDQLMSAVFPYMAAKMLIEPFGLRARIARRIVWLVFIVAVVSVYEFRMGDSLFRPALAGFFPGQKVGWFTQIRWGFGRVAGPYGHAILMGGIVAIALLLQAWLSRSRQWEPGFRWLPGLPISKPVILLYGLLMGSIMTGSRGPWLGVICGFALASIGTAHPPARRLLLVIVLLAVMGIAGYFIGKDYIAGAHLASGSNPEAESAAYRALLIDQYEDVALQRSVWGWGRATWPKLGGMTSIDNHYLFMALEEGMIGAGIFVLMLLTCAARLLRRCLSKSVDSEERVFQATMFGIIMAVAVTISTVFLGSQLYPLLFFFLGWSEGSLVFEPTQKMPRRMLSGHFNHMPVRGFANRGLSAGNFPPVKVY
jgi:hypothetical protein